MTEQPFYQAGLSFPSTNLARLLSDLPWENRTELRREAFMADVPYSYTYGRGAGQRTYTAAFWAGGVDDVCQRVNAILACSFGWGPLNVCFANSYLHERHALGWHADDHEGTDHTRPIAVVSFGQAREIWYREVGLVGELCACGSGERRGTCGKHPSPVYRQLLEDGSLFVMPPGFQAGHQHRIPKGDRMMAPRVSLTFRAFQES
jgi:alkylated DNA repair dioxygenase AlkB